MPTWISDEGLEVCQRTEHGICWVRASRFGTRVYVCTIVPKRVELLACARLQNLWQCAIPHAPQALAATAEAHKNAVAAEAERPRAKVHAEYRTTYIQRRLICISVTTRAAWRDRCHHSKRTSSSSTVASGGHTIVCSSTCDTFSCKSRLTCGTQRQPSGTNWHSRAQCGALPSECDQQQRCGTNAADRPGLNRRHRRRCLFVCA